MRIHTDKLTASDVYDAARLARVTLEDFTEHGSRSRARAFNVLLRGESRRRPNGGNRATDEYDGHAATWDQWGVFLGVLFDRDPDMFTPYDKSGAAFSERTLGRFDTPGVFPDDYHGDHRFAYAGTPRRQDCAKCSAANVWGF